MRLLRASLLLLLLSAGTTFVARAARDPLVEGWRALSGSEGQPYGGAAADLTAILAGGCALLVVLAWLWLVAAVGACTCDVVRAGRAPSVRAASTFLRPPLVRALVATCVGATALAGPAAQAQSPADRVQARPHDLRAATVAVSG